MSGYELTLRKEVMLEKAADIMGDLFWLQRQSGDTGIAEAARVMFRLVNGEKNSILLASDDLELDGIEGKMDFSKSFIKEIEKQINDKAELDSHALQKPAERDSRALQKPAERDSRALQKPPEKLYDNDKGARHG